MSRDPIQTAQQQLSERAARSAPVTYIALPPPCQVCKHSPFNRSLPPLYPPPSLPPRACCATGCATHPTPCAADAALATFASNIKCCCCLLGAVGAAAFGAGRLPGQPQSRRAVGARRAARAAARPPAVPPKASARRPAAAWQERGSALADGPHATAVSQGGPAWGLHMGPDPPTQINRTVSSHPNTNTSCKHKGTRRRPPTLAMLVQTCAHCAHAQSGPGGPARRPSGPPSNRHNTPGEAAQTALRPQGPRSRSGPGGLAHRPSGPQGNRDPPERTPQTIATQGGKTMGGGVDGHRQLPGSCRAW